MKGASFGNLLVGVTLMICGYCFFEPLSAGEAPNATWVTYFPYAIEVTGRIAIEHRFGPPNYGETPNIDRKLIVYMVILDFPINVRPNSKNNGDVGTFNNVTKMQIGLVEGVDNLSTYLGKHLRIKGQLIEGDTGEQFTNVILNIKDVEIIANHK